MCPALRASNAGNPSYLKHDDEKNELTDLVLGLRFLSQLKLDRTEFAGRLAVT